MKELTEILNVVLPIFIVISLGYFLSQIKFLSKGTLADLRKLVFYVSVPVLLFRSTASSTLHTAVNVKALLAVCLASLIVVSLSYLSLVHVVPSRRGVMAQAVYRTNMIFVGLPIIAYAYGDEGMASVVVLLAFIVPLFNLMAVLILALPHHTNIRGTGLMKGMVKDVAFNPFILGCALGLAFSFFGIELPRAVDRGMDLVGKLSLPLALIIVGSAMDFSRLKGEMIPTIMISLVKLVLYPAVIMTLMMLLGEKGIAMRATVLMMAAPVSPGSYIMAMEMRGDEHLAASLLIGSTTFSMLTLMGWLAFFVWLR